MDKLTQLLEKATDTDRVELKIHHNAQVACLKAYNDDPTALRQRDLKSARDALEDVINRLWPVYFPDEDRVETVKEAIAWLRAKGYKIANSKFYQDCKGTKKTPAKCRRQVDGSFLVRDLYLYAKSLTYLGDPAAGLDQAHRRKLELETRKLEKQTALLDHDLKVKQGAFVPREEADMMRAALVSILEANVKNMLMTHAGRWIAWVGGDPQKTSDFINAMIGF